MECESGEPCRGELSGLAKVVLVQAYLLDFLVVGRPLWLGHSDSPCFFLSPKAVCPITQARPRLTSDSPHCDTSRYTASQLLFTYTRQEGAWVEWVGSLAAVKGKGNQKARTWDVSMSGAA